MTEKASEMHGEGKPIGHNGPFEPEREVATSRPPWHHREMARVHTLDIYPHVEGHSCLGCTEAEAPPEQTSEDEAPEAAAEHPEERGPAPAEPAVEPRAWIEIELADASGAPVAGERCKVTAADGTEKEATTGSDGVARFTGLPAGSCQVTFPDLDREVWDSA